MEAGAVNKFEWAVFYSILTFTTSGYSDLTLNEGLRLLAVLAEPIES